VNRAFGALFVSALTVAACSSGVLDLLPGGANGGGGSDATSGAHGGEAGATSSKGGAPSTSSDTTTSPSNGGGGSSSSQSSATSGSGGSGGSCLDPDCPCGLQTCLGSCVDTQNDPSFCGGCDKPCKHNQVCNLGACSCLPGFTMCSDGSCHQLASDPDHCGSCTKVCGAAQACDSGECKDGCADNRSACAATNSRISCVNLASGEPFCGVCGTICGPTQVCAGQHCVDFKPATPCNACPCEVECNAIFAAPSSCCAAVAGGSQVICVHGDVCAP
jgi:hypothetical protein